MATVVSTVGTFLLNRRLVGQLGVDVPGVQPSGSGGLTAITGGPVCGDGHNCGFNTGAQFGQVTYTASQSYTIGGVPSAQAFGVVTRITGGVSTSSSGVPSAQAFGVPKTSYIEHPVGVPSAQLFGPVRLIYQQFLKPLGVPSAQQFGSAKTGMRAYNVWLHDAPCLDEDLAPIGETDLDLAALVCQVSGKLPVCDNPTICGAEVCGGTTQFLYPLSETDLDLQPLTPGSIDLQPAGCG